MYKLTLDVNGHQYCSCSEQQELLEKVNFQVCEDGSSLYLGYTGSTNQ